MNLLTLGCGNLHNSALQYIMEVVHKKKLSTSFSGMTQRYEEINGNACTISASRIEERRVWMYLVTFNPPRTVRTRTPEMSSPWSGCTLLLQDHASPRSHISEISKTTGLRKLKTLHSPKSGKSRDWTNDRNSDTDLLHNRPKHSFI